MNTAEILLTKNKKQYISKNMKQLGRGSSRVVYETEDNKTVVKYAIQNDKGVAQNRTEYELYENAKYYINLLCPVIEISENSKALIMGRAIPIRSRSIPIKYQEKTKAFKNKLNFIRKHLIRAIGYQKPSMVEIREKVLKQVSNKEEKKIFKSRFFIQLCELICNYNVILADITFETSWGLYKGRFVLVDYGCTREVLNKYYKNKRLLNY